MHSSIRLSPSAITVFAKCPAKFYYRHVLKLPEKATSALIRGRIIHKVMDVFFDTAKIENIHEGKHWQEVWKQFREIIFELLDSEWKKLGKPQGYEDLFKDAEEKSFLLQETKEFLDFFCVKLAYSLCNKAAELERNEWFEQNLKKHFYPKHRELKIELEKDNIVGFIDKTLSLYGEGVAIVDYKTSKSTLPHFIADSDLKQCKTYAWLWFQKFNELPRFISIFYIRDGESVYYPISEKDIDEIDRDIKEIRSRGTLKENFEKAPSMLCNYCDFFSNCFQSREEFEKEMQKN